MNHGAREHWSQVGELLSDLMEAAPEDRERIIRQRCGDREPLMSEIRSLLAFAEGAETYFEGLSRQVGAPPAGASGDPPAISDPMVGREFGAYRLIRRIGTGGMGAVYLGDRSDETFRKQAAVKLLPPALASEGMRQRFAVERRILARLQHPGIATLLDGGVSEDGIPFFIMEYVPGRPIDQHCRETGLSVEARLHLFQQVCAAVDHAHRNLVVHRDLKPSNILVSAEGSVKLLDFGIARLLAPDGDHPHQPLTELHGSALTPAFASPEQIRGETLTTAADVYSLGVLLYLLLSGRRPYEVSGLSPAEVERVICHEIPSPPSLVMAGQSKKAPVRRRQVEGDLDTIVLTALQKEPHRRYASVGGLSDDIRRHLNGHPVLARPDTLGYRVSRFVGRHRSLVASATAISLLLMGLAALAIHNALATRAQNVVISQERDRARLESAKAEAVSAFLVGLFAASDPDQTAGRIPTALELLEAGERSAEELRDEPAVQARVLDVIAQVHTRLGDYQRAEPLFREAVRLHRQEPPGARAALAGSLERLGDLLRRGGRLDEALPILHEARGIAQEEGDALLLATVLNDLGLTQHERGAYAEAEELHRQALELRRRAAGHRDRSVAASLQNIALSVAQLDRTVEAEALYREALEIHREQSGPEHTEVATTLTTLGRLLMERGEGSEAAPLMTEALRINRVRLGDRHPNVALVLNDLAALHAREGRFREAEDMFRDVLGLREESLGMDHPHVAISLNNLAYVLERQGRLSESLPLRNRALEIARLRLGDSHDNTGVFALNRAELLGRLGHTAEAEEGFRDAAAILARAFPRGHPLMARPLAALGELHLARERPIEAGSLLRQALEIHRAAGGGEEEAARLDSLLTLANSRTPPATR